VVPGALSAWRADAIVAVGGFTADTVAEDTDLTIAMRRAGWRIVYDEEAIGWTEAPETADALIRQREDVPEPAEVPRGDTPECTALTRRVEAPKDDNAARVAPGDRRWQKYRQEYDGRQREVADVDEHGIGPPGWRFADGQQLANDSAQRIELEIEAQAEGNHHHEGDTDAKDDAADQPASLDGRIGSRRPRSSLVHRCRSDFSKLARCRRRPPSGRPDYTRHHPVVRQNEIMAFWPLISAVECATGYGMLATLVAILRLLGLVCLDAHQRQILQCDCTVPYRGITG
jgi:hypothetical protein